ncbi:MAG: DNA polymerase I [Bacteroidales bacterium]|nr:DNA polymerase I [Bacteroidales bacterium]
MDKLFLIDGHALIFKMYYAFLRRPMVNSKGADMSILYGFTKYLLEMVEREKPTHLAVAFDPPGGTFRNELYPEYKGTRPPTPQLIIDALEPLTELVQAMNIPVLMVRGFEADDVIGSMALRSAREGMDVYMVTPDKDYGQLISEHVFQYKPGKAGGDDEIIDRSAICEKWGILDPVQIIDMLAICGDTADNVPGVKGVGEVGAGKLVSKYGSVENIYAHLGELSPRQQAQFEEARPHMGLSKELVTIKTDIPLETTAEDMRLNMNFSPAIADLFEKYEFNSLKRFIAHVGPSTAAKERREFTVNEISVTEMVEAVRKAGHCGLITEAYGEGIFSPVKRVVLGCDGKACAIPDDLLETVIGILENPGIDKYGYDLKLQANLLDHAGIALQGKWYDIALMHYLVDPEKSHAVDILSRSCLDIELEETPAEAGTGSLFDDVPEEGGNARTREAAVLPLLGARIREELADRQKLYDDMEEPLAKVLAKMERAGVKVDLRQLDRFAEGLRQEMVAREAHIRELVGEPGLNISSPKQVGDILFDKLKLDPKAKKSARGQYSTDEATLLAIADRHPVVNEILEFRAVKKLLSTYIEPFPTYVSPVDGRVHTTFNQALTATGRLSSSNPNLQNIPIRTERGKEIRKAFIPGTPEGVIVSADYSQIELRIMAHLSQDEHLVRAFREGVDVHAATAARIFHIPVEEVSREQRGRAKTANFGIMYGISSFGLAQRLHLGRKEAKELIDGYFTSFPAIRSFIDDSIAFARENGYVETLFGRRRYLPDINAKNATVRSLAERNAVNAPIQGTSADIIKLAMIRVDERLAEAGLRSRMVLQIHDELVFDAIPEEVPELEKIVVEVMENVLKLSIPLTVECSDGKNWLEAH